jgi:hypothetical protein
MPASARRAATIRLMRKASGPSTTTVRRFMDSALSPQGWVIWDRVLPAPTFLPFRSQASAPALRCPRPDPQAGRDPCVTLAWKPPVSTAQCRKRFSRRTTADRQLRAQSA